MIDLKFNTKSLAQVPSSKANKESNLYLFMGQKAPSEFLIKYVESTNKSDRKEGREARLDYVMIVVY